MPSVLSGVRKMNWYFLSSRAFLMMLSSEILLKICIRTFCHQVKDQNCILKKIPSVESIHKDIKLVQDPEGRSHRVPEGQNQRDAGEVRSECKRNLS